MMQLSEQTNFLKKSKGRKTRDSILFEARKIFNEDGVFLTLSELSKLIGITIGGITNHFPTKEHLFVGLSEQYEAELNDLVNRFPFGAELNFQQLSRYFSGVLDIQYEHRCVILFFSVMHQSQTVMMAQVVKTWTNRQQRIGNLIKSMVSLGLLDPLILSENEFDVFKFQFTSLFTSWMMSYSLYDNATSFESIKPVYLRGILQVFEKYLTDEGRSQFDKVF